MELLPNVDESAVINDTPERIDTWNQPRSDEALRSFVMNKMVYIDDFDDEFELAA